MSERWDFYWFVVEDKPCSTMLDLGIADAVPVAERPWLISIRMPLERPRKDGLCDNDEAKSLGELEDALALELARACDAWFVGRMTWNGTRDLFYYARSPDGLEPALSAAFKGRAPRRLMTRTKQDPEWRHYLDVLYPGPLEWQWMKDRHTVEKLRERGDRAEVPRPIDHFAYFETQPAASAFADACRTMGFETSVRPADAGRGFQVHATREDPAELAHVNDISCRFLGLAEEHGGSYDGWGCTAVKDSDA